MLAFEGNGSSLFVRIETVNLLDFVKKDERILFVSW